MTSPGLYVHIPFCRSKCPYCAFFSVPSTSLIPRWLNAFRKEVVFYKGQFNGFDSLYFGGGTPTMLGAGVLSALMDQIFTHFKCDPNPEITIEANPCDLSQEMIGALKEMGFNRVSLGVQSFDDRTLTILGRNHTVRQSEQALKGLRSAGFENISLDLIYGVGGQWEKEWIDTLKRAIEFQPEHLSCYQLTIEKKTRFGMLADKGELQTLNEDEESACFLATSQFLEQNGYTHYEISNFARERACYSRHNCKYWRHTPYLGLGPSAHSFFEPRRWWNIRSVRGYCEALEEGLAPVEGSEDLSAEQLRFESIILGLRTKEGFDQRRINSHHPSRDILARLQHTGFIRIVNGMILPTRKGFLVADHLASCLGD